MFLQDTPPDTSAYMIAGYAVFFVFAAIYLLSFFVRSRNLKQDLDTLESMQKESKPVVASAVKAASPQPRKPRASKAKTTKKKTARKK